MKYTLNYIWVNADDLHVKTEQCKYLQYVKEKHGDIYTSRGITTRYWAWNELAEIIKGYDNNLYNLCLQISPEYSTLLSDIARFVLLYHQPGVYIDCDFVLTEYFDEYIKTMPREVEFVSRSTHNSKNTMVSGLYTTVKNTSTIALFLERVKTRLEIAKRDKLGGKKALNHIVTVNLREMFNTNMVDTSKSKYEPWPAEPNCRTPVEYQECETPYVRYLTPVRVSFPKYKHWCAVPDGTPIFY